MQYTEQELVRREKLKNIPNPYPEKYERTHELKDARKLEDGTQNVKVAGRIIFMRKMGKMSFITIGDVEGRLQLSFKLDTLGEEKYNFFKTNVDIGDFIGAEGEIFTTQTGEKTLRANNFTFLGKALKPLPEKFHGLEDIETIYRQRYVDLIMNEDARKKFLFRSKLIKEIRNYLDSIGYIEIETPILSNKASGATAKPFITHHNALDIDFYLRIAPETYLKRAVVGGFTKVFEIARCFRNEGMDASHLQDFTMLEAYGAYLNYKDNMNLTRNMIQTIIQNIFGTLKITFGDKEVDLSGEWEAVSFRELLLKYCDIDLNIYNTKEKLLAEIRRQNIDIDSEVPLENLGYGNMVDQLYKKVARPNVINPIFLTEHPIDLSPLARANDDNPNITDRFQLVINGAEIINAYSELVDPIEQQRRLQVQAELKAGGDEEAMPMDTEYIEAMEYGMPPISGWGMGIDRLVQLLTNSKNIKDVVMFPLMKPLGKKEVHIERTNKTIDFSKVVVEPLFTEEVNFETFSKCDFRVVKVKDCEAVAKSKKLLKFTLNDGSDQDRIILSGIHSYYEPEELIGKTLVAITNLPPKTMMGIDSCGMLLSAIHEEEGEEKLNLLMLENNIPAGAKLY